MADLSKRTLLISGWLLTLSSGAFAFLAGATSLWFLLPTVAVSVFGLFLRLKADEAPE